MAYKKWKITIQEKDFDKKDEAVQEVVYAATVTKAKAERIAVLVVADAWKMKTSDLEVQSSEQMDKEDTLSWKEFTPVVGIQMDGFGKDDYNV